MMTRTTIALALVLALAAAVLPAGERILISNQNGDRAELIELATLKSLAVTAVGRQPLTAAVTGDRRFGLIASVGNTTNAGSMSVLDLVAAGMPVVATVSLNSRAYGVAATPNSKLALVTRVTTTGSVTTPELQLVDLTTSPPQDLGQPIPIPAGRSAYGVDISPDGKIAYVIDYSGATLTVFDLTQSPPVVLAQLPTNPSAIFLKLSNDGRRLVIASIATPAQVGVWNTEPLVPTKLGNVAVGSNPGAIPSFDPGNRFAVVVASGGRTAHTINTHTSLPVALGTSAAFGSDLRGVTVTTDGLAAWAACRSTSRLHELDLSLPAQPLLTARTVSVASGPNSVVAFGEVHAHGVPAIGSVYPIQFSSPADAGRPYLLGASFGSRPGFPLGARRVPLNPDALFGLSQVNPAIFQRFAGVLDAGGQAVAAIRIPAVPGLRGLPFVVAGVVVDPASPLGIGTISNAEVIVLQ
ncbi:MAG: hypothetical protein JXQ29_12500 [Planctomycetes bacterium]|nr:hypothetical protein [Planctomycetota bacterium]